MKSNDQTRLEQVKGYVEKNIVAAKEGRKCVDGRYLPSEAVGMIARPGGDCGYVMALMAVNREKKIGLTPEECFNVVYKIIVHELRGVFYLHTDLHAHSIHYPISTIEDRNLIGCGHLMKAASQKSMKNYNIISKDARRLILYTRNIAAINDKLDVVHLNGHHEERGVLVIKSDRFTVHSYNPEAEEMYFVYDESRDNEFMHKLVKELDMPAVTFEDLKRESDKQLQATLQNLAKGLPIYLIEFDDSKPNVSYVANGLIDGEDPVCHTGGNPSNPWDPNLPEISPTAFPTALPTAIPTAGPTTLPTTTPGTNTSINLNLLLHGIGSSGDNTNPTTFTLSNQNPLHTSRTASVSIFDASNNPVTSSSGTVSFTSASGSFKGTVDLGGSLASGVYTIKVKTDQHLYRLVAGIQTLTTGQVNTLPTTELVAGDTNDDNKINILDYNALINCYSDLSPAIACTPALKLQTDLNDDGNVNQVDYNLFLREIATQPGQ